MQPPPMPVCTSPVPSVWCAHCPDVPDRLEIRGVGSEQDQNLLSLSPTRAVSVSIRPAAAVQVCPLIPVGRLLERKVWCGPATGPPAQDLASGFAAGTMEEGVKIPESILNPGSGISWLQIHVQSHAVFPSLSFPRCHTGECFSAVLHTLGNQRPPSML